MDATRQQSAAATQPRRTCARWFIDHWRVSGVLLFLAILTAYVVYSLAVSQKFGVTTRPEELARVFFASGDGLSSAEWPSQVVDPSAPPPYAWVMTSSKQIGWPIPLVGLRDFDVFVIDQAATAANADGRVEVARAPLVHSRIPILDWRYRWNLFQWRPGAPVLEFAFATKGRSSVTYGQLQTTAFWRHLLIALLVCLGATYGLNRLVVGRERRRRAAGRCTTCGHSRQGLEPSALCTECGVSLGLEPRVFPSRPALLGVALLVVVLGSSALGIATSGWPFGDPSHHTSSVLRPRETSRGWTRLGQIGWPIPMVQWSVSHPLDGPDVPSRDAWPMTDQAFAFTSGLPWYRPGVRWLVHLRPWFNSQRESVSVGIYLDAIALHACVAVVLWWTVRGIMRRRSVARNPAEPHSATPLPPTPARADVDSPP